MLDLLWRTRSQLPFLFWKTSEGTATVLEQIGCLPWAILYGSILFLLYDMKEKFLICSWNKKDCVSFVMDNIMWYRPFQQWHKKLVRCSPLHCCTNKKTDLLVLSFIFSTHIENWWKVKSHENRFCQLYTHISKSLSWGLSWFL